jgi:hypothetical protein
MGRDVADLLEAHEKRRSIPSCPGISSGDTHVAVVTMNTKGSMRKTRPFFTDLHTAVDRLDKEFSDYGRSDGNRCRVHGQVLATAVTSSGAELCALATVTMMALTSRGT